MYRQLAKRSTTREHSRLPSIFCTRLIFAIVVALHMKTVSAELIFALPRFIETVATSEIFPGADRLGEISGAPPVAEAIRGSEVIGYVFGEPASLFASKTDAVGFLVVIFFNVHECQIPVKM